MSNKTNIHLQLYNSLKESIDFENARDLNLRTDVVEKIRIKGMKVEIAIFKLRNTDLFKEDSILYNKFNDKYYSLGFAVEDSETQVTKTDYRTLARILGIIAKSTLEWVKKNNPDVILVGPSGASKREINKKLSIYTSILERNRSLMDSLGYFWDYIDLNYRGKSAYIAKKSLFD